MKKDAGRTAATYSGFPPGPIGGIMGAHVRHRNPHSQRHRIDGQRCADDYEVFWRGMSIGRIRKAAGTHAAPLIEEAERSVDILLKLALNFLALAWPDIFLPVEQPLLSCK